MNNYGANLLKNKDAKFIGLKSEMIMIAKPHFKH